MSKPVSSPASHPAVSVTASGDGNGWALDRSARHGDGVEMTLKHQSGGGVIRLWLPAGHLLELAELATDTPE